MSIWNVSPGVSEERILELAREAAVNTGKVQRVTYADGRPGVVIDGTGREYLEHARDSAGVIRPRPTQPPSESIP